LEAAEFLAYGDSFAPKREGQSWTPIHTMDSGVDRCCRMSVFLSGPVWEEVSSHLTIGVWHFSSKPK
jgi:hypothetical protein